MNTESFGSVIKQARLKKGLSLRELSRRIDISHPYLSQLENGHNDNPSTSIILKLSQELGVSFAYLVSLTDIDIGLKSNIPSHYIEALKNIDFKIMSKMNSFEDFMEWVKKEEDYLNNPDQYDETKLRDLYKFTSQLSKMEQSTKQLAKMKIIEDDVAEKIHLSGTYTLEFALNSAIPITVNNKILTEEDKKKLISIAEIIFQ